MNILGVSSVISIALIIITFIYGCMFGALDGWGLGLSFFVSIVGAELIKSMYFSSHITERKEDGSK